MISFVWIVIATLVALFMIAEIGKAKPDSVLAIVRSKAWDHQFSAQILQEKENKYLMNMNKYKENQTPGKWKKAKKKVAEWDKQIKNDQKLSSQYLNGKKLGFSDMIPLAGYQLLDDLKVDANSDILRKFTKVCENTGYVELERPLTKGNDGENEFNGNANAQMYAKYILSNLVSFLMISVLLLFIVLGVTSALGLESTQVILFSVVALLAPLLVGYLPYQNLQDTTKARNEELDRDFPNVLSKLALLTTAGMSIQNAIEETAMSGDTAIYLDLQMVIDDMRNASTMESALTRMQYRCDNRFIDRTVSLIIQSYKEGNAKLSDDLRALNAECWLEKKHNSRRMAEVVQNKLFVPTILMFIGLLVCIVVPAMSGFSLNL